MSPRDGRCSPEGVEIDSSVGQTPPGAGAPDVPVFPSIRMKDYTRISSDEVLFLADSHFRDRRNPGEADRRGRFIEFLSKVRSGAAMFLLGDIFDFYFEYASVVPKRHFDILHALHDCARRGVEVHFLGGNHDYWFGSFLRDEIGLVPHGDDVFVACQGRKIWCTHGDLFLTGDKSYRAVRSIIRNPGVIALAKGIHPDLMDAIARRVSHDSKRRNRRSVEDAAREIASRPEATFFCNGNDVIVMGHVHFPLHEVKNGKDLVIVGDWITQFTYARLVDGKISLEAFIPEAKD
jgi:UDP-2,3-diacylglucosamine hydrolase